MKLADKNRWYGVVTMKEEGFFSRYVTSICYLANGSMEELCTIKHSVNSSKKIIKSIHRNLRDRLKTSSEEDTKSGLTAALKMIDQAFPDKAVLFDLSNNFNIR